MIIRPLAYVLLLCAIGSAFGAAGHSGLFESSQDQIHANTQYRGVSAESFTLLEQKLLKGDGPMLLDTYMASGVRTICEMPEISIGETEEDGEKASKQEVSVASLLLPLRNLCMRYIEGWWTYEFCVGKQLRQYHLDAKGKVEKEYFLGIATSADTTGTNPSEPRAAPAEISEEEFLHRLGATKKHQEEKTSFYAEQYKWGTGCDVTQGTPRQFEARWSCASGAAGTGIRTVAEPASCQYVIEIDTPLLCAHPAYRSTQTPTFVTMCYFLDPETKLAQQKAKTSTVKEEIEAANARWREEHRQSFVVNPASSPANKEGEDTVLNANIGETQSHTPTETQYDRNGELASKNSDFDSKNGDSTEAAPAATTTTTTAVPAEYDDATLSIGRTFTMRPITEEAESGESVDSTNSETSSVLRQTVRERISSKVNLAIVSPDENGNLPRTEDLDDDELDILSGERLDRLLTQLTDSELLMLLTTMDDAVRLLQIEHETMKQEGIPVDEDEKVIIELDTTGHPLGSESHHDIIENSETIEEKKDSKEKEQKTEL